MSKRIVSLVVATLFVGAAIAAALNAQRIQDTILYYQFEPSSDVASLASESGMSDHGRFLFYVSQPAVLEAEEFNNYCEKRELTSAILGCYNGHNIYIYNVTDERLDGIQPTTAAHEMLHAAYRRLSDKDLRMVNSLLEAEYDKLKDNQELANRMDFYARTQPGERENELHSIIGTEIAEISDELEDYYKRYFSDRSMVVAQHGRYYSVFEDLKRKSETLNVELENINKGVSAKRVRYVSESDALQSDILSFNARADRGDFQSQADFSYERQILINRTSTLELLRQEINNDINRYNKLVAELNDLSVETDALNRSMDSHVEPAPSL